MKDVYPSVHASEYGWACSQFDVVVDNNGSIEDLYKELKNLV
jgi:dephospho-CoA kinase